MDNRVRLTIIRGIDKHERRGIFIKNRRIAGMHFIRFRTEIIQFIALHIIQSFAHLAWKFFLQRRFQDRQRRFQIAVARLHAVDRIHQFIIMIVNHLTKRRQHFRSDFLAEIVRVFRRIITA